MKEFGILITLTFITTFGCYSQVQDEYQESTFQGAEEVSIGQHNPIVDLINSNSVGQTIKIGNLEIMKNDIVEETLNWNDATAACSNLGDGWRLPTKKELHVMYINRKKIGGFSSVSDTGKENYWSSTSESGFNENVYWQSFSDNDISLSSEKIWTYGVRAVRTITPAPSNNVKKISWH